MKPAREDVAISHWADNASGMWRGPRKDTAGGQREVALALRGVPALDRAPEAREEWIERSTQAFEFVLREFRPLEFDLFARSEAEANDADRDGPPDLLVRVGVAASGWTLD